MKLNPDCMRDILFAIEKIQKYVTDEDGTIAKKDFLINELHDELPMYKKEDIYYTLFSLDQAGLVSISERWTGNSLDFCYINYLTFAGHEFLSKIRDQARWSGIKKALPAIRNYSLDAINAISQGMTSAAISEHLSKCL